MKFKWYKFIWEDGTTTISGSYSRDELTKTIQEHGRLVSSWQI